MLTLAAVVVCRAGTATCGEPPREVVADVLSVPIHANEIEPSAVEMRDLPVGVSKVEWTEHLRARKLEARIASPLQKRFCTEHACAPTTAEVQAVLDMGRDSRARDGPDPRSMPDGDHKLGATPPERSHQEMQRRVARGWVASWKFHKALYDTYGGDVIMQVVAPNAVGARRKWLEDEEQKGHFHITTPALRTAFFDAVSAYGGVPIPAERAGEAFANPPWAVRGGDPKR